MNDQSPPTTTTTTTTTTITTTTCGHCRRGDRKILHHIRLSGTFHRLCTTCVLRLHPKSFCPSCLTVFPPSHPFLCPNCPSSSHRPCLNPNYLVFDPKPSNWNNNNNDWGIGVSDARLLLAAAEISSMSMSRAEAAALTEADWRAKEAAEWRKKAKEAVDHVLKLMEIEKKNRGDHPKDVFDRVNRKGLVDVGEIEVFEALSAVNLAGESVCRGMKI